MGSASKAGVLYFAIVFAAGFGLGVLRVLVLAPRIGEDLAGLFELPIILLICWVVSLRLIAWARVADRLTPRLIMGAVAFLLLMAAEVVVSVSVFGRTLSEHIAYYETRLALLGLAGQVAFALFPAMQLFITPKPSR